MKIKKSSAAVLAAIILLAGAAAVLGVINYSNMRERRELLRGYGGFLLTCAYYTRVVSPDDLLAIGYAAVSAQARGETRNFTGVPLAHIFAHFGMDLAGADAVIFSSHDGFTSAVSAADYANIFVVFEEDGQLLGSREEGGLGPYMIVIAGDPFPNRWARYLMEIAVR